MTVHELIELLQRVPKSHRGRRIKVWLPGSTISLTGTRAMLEDDRGVLIEGNVDPGSALEAVDAVVKLVLERERFDD